MLGPLPLSPRTGCGVHSPSHPALDAGPIPPVTPHWMRGPTSSKPWVPDLVRDDKILCHPERRPRSTHVLFQSCRPSHSRSDLAQDSTKVAPNVASDAPCLPYMKTNTGYVDKMLSVVRRLCKIGWPAAYAQSTIFKTSQTTKPPRGGLNVKTIGF
jgi:hypothetical protein